MMTQVVKVRRVTLAACMTCPLCKKLLREATTISECLHTFCRRCIYEKLTDEEVDCCPICNTDLGCVPVEKLRPDHNLQDVRNKIFPLKGSKGQGADIVPSITLPVRRKERSLSSLVISTPRVTTQTGLTGRRTKSIARKAASLRGSNFAKDEPVKIKAENAEDHHDSSCSHETQDTITQRQNPSNGEPSNYICNINTENGAEQQLGKSGLWKPLNCLLEAATRSKSFKSNFQASSVKAEQADDPDSGVNVHKAKFKEHARKPKLQDDKKGTASARSGLGKARRLHGISRKRAAMSREISIPSQPMVTPSCLKREKKISHVWFSLVASDNQEGDEALPQISACYLRIKDGNIPVSFIKKYLVKKLDLKSEAEVEISCCGQPVLPSLAMHSLVDLWLRKSSTSKRVAAASGSSAKDLVMVLAYARKSSVS
ncbi:E3 ubiquitin protein ligase [Nymphaea thermarum]|nr:E3 ubiquitin protein ligase [Nymphaea thermarum]